MKRSSTLRSGAGLLLVLIGLHAVYGTARVPHSVIGERWSDVAEFQERGAARYHLDNAHRKGAAAVEWILANTPEDAVVLRRAELTGSCEFVPALIWPRLLVSTGHVDADATEFAGRPIAVGEVPGRGHGQVVLVGSGHDLALEVR